MSKSPDLLRFHAAQDQPRAGHADALREMRAGAKRSHWIWYVLPQLSGLGVSDMAQTYGLRGVAEAEAYLRDPVLRSRLLAITSAVAAHVLPPASTPLASLMGSEIDALKLVSSLTLFEHVARTMPVIDHVDDVMAIGDAATRILDAAASQGYARCPVTLASLESD
jgi:uncharacterized protein (DUF1810 family)